jgi:hypothetical protein
MKNRCLPGKVIVAGACGFVLLAITGPLLIPVRATRAGDDSAASGVAAARDQSNGNTTLASTPAERDGLRVVIQPLKATFASDEPLGLKVTYRNVSKEAFRLRNEIDPAPYGYWVLTIEDVRTGMTYTGASILPSGATPELDSIHPSTATLQPGESQSTTVTFQRFGFIEGTLNYQAAKNALFLELGTPPDYRTLKPLPLGTYKVSLEIRSFRFTDSPTAGDVLRAEQERFDRAVAGNDPIPLWKDYEIESNPVEIVIAGR